jgi:integrase
MKDALAFAALTGLRENEIIQARRSHIRNGWLHIPKPKGGTDLAFDRHVPTQCLDLIGRQLSNDQIFPFYKIRIKGLASTHACRHYFLGYIEAALGAPRRVTRALVNHTGKTDVTDGYGRVLPEVHAEWSQKAADAIADRMGWCL